MPVFFTADTHFGDHRVLNTARRPFESVAAMDAALLDAWNAAVGTEDDIWHLGDFARDARIGADIFDRLAGRKHLIVGNNDPLAVLALPWCSVAPYHEMTLDGTRLVLCHYPFRSWNGIGKGVVDLHGHSHGRLKPMPRQYDVGVDPRGFRPVTLTALLQK